MKQEYKYSTIARETAEKYKYSNFATVTALNTSIRLQRKLWSGKQVSAKETALWNVYKYSRIISFFF